jgi:hypothetical protein
MEKLLELAHKKGFDSQAGHIGMIEWLHGCGFYFSISAYDSNIWTVYSWRHEDIFTGTLEQLLEKCFNALPDIRES